MKSTWKSIMTLAMAGVLVVGVAVAGWAHEAPAREGKSRHGHVSSQEGIFIERAGLHALVDEISEKTGLSKWDVKKMILKAANRNIVSSDELAHETHAGEGATDVALETEPAESLGVKERLQRAYEEGKISEERYNRMMTLIETVDMERDDLVAYVEELRATFAEMPNRVESRLDALLEEERITAEQHEKLSTVLEKGKSLMEKIADATFGALVPDSEADAEEQS